MIWPRRPNTSAGRSSSGARPGCRCASRRCCFATPAPATCSRWSWRGARSRSSSTVASSFSRLRTSRTCSRCCAGPTTRATPWPHSACCSCCRAWGRSMRASASSCWKPQTGSLEALQALHAAAGAGRPTTASCWRCCKPSPSRKRPWPGQVRQVRDWYQPHLERIYEHVHTRVGDLDQLEQLSAQYPSRERFITELTLDPPHATERSGGHAAAG